MSDEPAPLLPDADIRARLSRLLGEQWIDTRVLHLRHNITGRIETVAWRPARP